MKKPLSDFEYAIRFAHLLESNELTDGEMLAGFQQIINTGAVWKLRIEFRQMANALLVTEKCTHRPI